MTLRNQHVKPEDLFFFGDHIIFWTKLQHFLRKSVMFKLAPDPLLVPGGTVFAPQKVPLSKISDDVIACSLWFAPPPIKNPGCAYGHNSTCLTVYLFRIRVHGNKNIK